MSCVVFANRAGLPQSSVQDLLDQDGGGGVHEWVEWRRTSLCTGELHTFALNVTSQYTEFVRAHVQNHFENISP